MADSSITIKVHKSWWVRWYLTSISALARLHLMEPDIEKIGAFVLKNGIRLDCPLTTRGAK